MWITQKKPESMSDLHQLSCGVTHMRHAVLGLDFWGYLCYNSIIQKNKEADSMSLANKALKLSDPPARIAGIKKVS